MAITKKRNYPYLFTCKYKRFRVIIDGKLIEFNNGEYSTHDTNLANKIREYIKKRGLIKEVPIVEIARREKEKEELPEPKMEEVIKEAEEKIKKLYACPECGKEFAKLEELEHHKKYKHPEIFLLHAALTYRKEKGLGLKKEFSRKKVAKRRRK